MGTWQTNILSQGENSPAFSALFLFYNKSGEYKMPVTKFSSLFSYTKFRLLRSLLCFDFLFWIQRFLFKEILRDKFMYKNVDFEIRYPTLRGPYLGQILINLKNVCNFLNQNFVGFTNRAKLFIQCALEAEKLQKNKVAKVLVDTLYVYMSIG